MAQDSIWFRIGYALEQARAAPVSPPSRLRALADRLPGRTGGKDDGAGAGRPEKGRTGTGGGNPGGGGGAGGPTALDTLLAAGGGAVLARALHWWEPRRRPGVLGLVKGGAAGAGAALLRELLRPLLHGELRAPELHGKVGEEVLAGVARGLVYASLVEPRLPGPELARGLVYGTAEYLVSPWGGLTALLGRRAPHRRIPLVSSLFEDHEPERDTFVDHVAFAVALAVLYGVVEGGTDARDDGPTG